MRAIAAIAVLLGVLAGAAGAEPPKRLVLLDPEIAGDLTDPRQQPDWPRRLTDLRDAVADGLEAEGVYALADRARADAELAELRMRANAFQCVACAVAVAEAAGADRVLSLQVFRMSQLVLSLNAVLRDGGSGDVRYARSLSFRGDDDRAWQTAAAYLVRDMTAIPPDRR
jgi:Protein of unknown function (DUF2380)